MGETFTMSGVIEWLKAASIRKTTAKERAEDTKKKGSRKSRSLRKQTKRAQGNPEDKSGSR